VSMSTAELRTLYRPVGLREMERILEVDARRFPPRHKEQPIFYPVLVQEYAEQIARQWNTKDRRSGFAGFVTRFELNAAYAARFEEHVVGAAIHRELWVPAEELDEFNDHIAQPIAMIAAYYGPEYEGPIPQQGPLQGLDAREQVVALDQIGASGSLADVVTANAHAVQLSFAYWADGDFTGTGLSQERRRELLRDLLVLWTAAHPDTRLVGSESLDA
jgi:hypothetical protein